MPALSTALGILLLSFLLQYFPLPVVWSGWGAFATAAAAAGGVGAVLGRLVLCRLTAQRFARAAVAVVLILWGLSTAVSARQIHAGGSGTGESEGLLLLLLGLLPAWSAYLGVAVGTFLRCGRSRGFGFVEWFGPRLFFLPHGACVFLILPQLALESSEALRSFFLRRPYLEPLSVLAVVLPVVYVGPFLIRALFPAGPVPEPLRTCLMMRAVQAGVRLRSVAVWKTGARSLLNACVAGVFPRTRFVLITDALIRLLDRAEVEAVFAHEVSHVRHKHFLLLAALLGGFSGSLLGLLSAVEGQVPGTWIGCMAGAGIGFFLLGPFARISRVLELEADIGAIGLGIPGETLAGALEKLGRLSGASRRRHSWRHFSIPYRVAAIRAWCGGEEFRRRFVKRKRIAAACCLAAACAGLTGIGFSAARAGSRGGAFLTAWERRRAIEQAAVQVEEALFQALKETQSPPVIPAALRRKREQAYLVLLRFLAQAGRVTEAEHAALWAARRFSLLPGHFQVLVRAQKLLLRQPKAAAASLEAFLAHLQQSALGSDGSLVLGTGRSFLFDQINARAAGYLLLARAYGAQGLEEKSRRARRKGRALIGLPPPLADRTRP